MDKKMRGDLKNNSVSNRLLNLFLADKKKAVVALCLVGIMMFMWLKVLIGAGPAEVKAASLKNEVAYEQPKEVEQKLLYITLPEIKGRNDILSRDFFDVEVASLTETEADIVSSEEKDLTLVLTEELKLEAIVLGQHYQAFINDKLLAVGDKFFVSGEVDTYECEVIRIEKNKVFVRCGEIEISLKLAKAEVVN